MAVLKTAPAVYPQQLAFLFLPAASRRRNLVDLHLAPSSQSSKGTTRKNMEFAEIKYDGLIAETVLGFRVFIG